MSKYTSQKIKSIIVQYATAHQALEELQNNLKAMPKGGQKIDAIGEYYAYKYYQQHYPKGTQIEFDEQPKNAGHICVTTPDRTVRIQVKTVLDFAPKQRERAIFIKPNGWDRLLVISLGEDFLPMGCWLFDKNQDFKDKPDNFRLTVPKYSQGAFANGSKAFVGKSADCSALRRACGISPLSSTSQYLQHLPKLGGTNLE